MHARIYFFLPFSMFTPLPLPALLLHLSSFQSSSDGHTGHSIL